ncbi:MAG TPA: hypothetical protein VKB93_06820, partial [Thermoanaerobaculia bacterium]|nr:hypothetical protein [Thermoanaerobaculia bacterium]
MLAFVLPLLLGIPAPALGPEVALSRNSDSGPAAFAQTSTALVTNGSEFVVSWMNFDETDTPRFELRLDSLGQPLEPFARKIDDYRGYASTGDGDYLALWVDDRYFWVQRVDADGKPLGPPNPVLEHGEYYGSYGLFANRTTYLLVVSVGYPEQKHIAIVLDRIGRVIRQRDLDIAYFLKAVPLPDGFVIAGCKPFSPCTSRLSAISNSGTLKKLPDPPQTPLWDMRASGDRLMISWWERAGAARFMILGFDGNVLKPPFTIPIPAESLPAGLLWDGREFLLLLNDMTYPTGKLRAIRLDGNGNPLNEPYVLSETASTSAKFATNETTALLIWSDTRFSSEPDVVGLRFRYFSELADSSDRVVLLSRSLTAQSGVKIASSGSHRMAVWTNEPSHTISGWIDGTEFNVTNEARREVALAAVAGSPNSFLVAWKELSSVDDRGALFVRRYALNGTPLDEEPVEIFEPVPGSRLSLEPPALLYDGDSFVLFEGDGNAIRMARIDPQTGAVTTSSVPLSTYSKRLLRPIATAAGWYVPFIRVSSRDPHNVAVAVASIARDGSARDFETPFLCDVQCDFSAAYAQGTVTQLFVPH